MEPYGYLLKGTAKSLPTDYIPSLIGIAPDQIVPSADDRYFERVEITDRSISVLRLTSFVAFDSLPSGLRDPILAVRSPAGSYYIPASELYEIAASHQDDDTIESIALLGIVFE